MARVRKFPSVVGHRMETGPIRFGGDHPGMFFRGDDALGKATELRALAVSLRGGGFDNMAEYLDRLADQFASCAADKIEAA